MVLNRPVAAQFGRRQTDEFFRETDGGFVCVTPRGKRQQVELRLDGSDYFRVAEADLMNIVAVKIEITPTFRIFNPRAFGGAQDVQAGRGHGLMNECIGIVGE